VVKYFGRIYELEIEQVLLPYDPGKLTYWHFMGYCRIDGKQELPEEIFLL